MDKLDSNLMFNPFLKSEWQGSDYSSGHRLPSLGARVATFC